MRGDLNAATPSLAVSGQPLNRSSLQPVSLPPVACVVLNWNGWADTVACLRTLYQSDYGNLSVLVVDNGSTDGSVERILSECPAQEILRSGKNLGFGAGNNLGIRTALARGAQYVWLLNNDTLVHADTLSSLVACAEANPSAGQIGSVLYYSNLPSKVQAWGGGRINLWTGRITHFHDPVLPGEMDYTTAASVLMRRSALEQVGVFDETFFMYFEDTDLSFRMRKSGWLLDICTSARVLHHEGAASQNKRAKFDGMVSRSAVHFFRKHAPVPAIPMLVFLGGRALKRLVTGRLDCFRAIVAAWTQPQRSA